jgi:tripartite ATP-independent transporter DctP family solute receptor
MNQFVSRARLAGMAVAGALGLAATPASALEIKSSDVHGPDYPTVAAIQYMGDLLAAWTNNRITMNIFHSMQLGGEKEALEQVQVGALEMTRVSVGVVGPIVDEFNAFNLPYLFESVEHMHTVVDGEIGQRLLDDLEAGGLIGLGYMDAGARSFYNKERSITSLEDLQGLKIRVMQNPIFVDMATAMGADGIPVAFNELYTAMQTGVVDGAENNPPTYLTQNHYEVAGHYTLTEHLIVPEIFVFSKQVWDTLDTVDQQLIQKAANYAVLKERELWAEMEQAALDQLIADGYDVVVEIDKTPFIEATAPVREKFGEKYGALMEEIALYAPEPEDG